MVGCASPSSSTSCPLTQALALIRYWMMATRAGWARAFIMPASLFCLSVNISDLVRPTSLSFNCNITMIWGNFANLFFGGEAKNDWVHVVPFAFYLGIFQ